MPTISPISSTSVGSSVGSRFLARLPSETQRRLVSQSTRVPLQKEDHLCEAGAPLTWSYLPCTGIVSMQTMTLEGESVEVAMIGREGIVGVPSPVSPLNAPHTAVVLLEGEALKIRADLLRTEIQRDVAFQTALIHYSYSLITQIARGSVCHRFHSARQRLARWLLEASDRTQSPRILMTQERLGQVLGLQRTGVTPASIALQDAGAIKSRHGRITIADRHRLELAACECYSAAREPHAS
jgi:CRP-like cAMP-binding protein